MRPAPAQSPAPELTFLTGRSRATTGRATTGRGARRRLLRVVSDHEFTPYFQAIVDLRTGRIVGCEALTRWHDGTSPQLRFAQATRLGVGLEVERATAAAALAAAREIDPDTFLSVNASAALMTADGEIAGLLDGTRRAVVLEITEHEPVADYGPVREALARLRPAVRLAVDDAGAGYASLRHVLALRPDVIKLDMCWVRGIDTDSPRRTLVAGLGRVAEEMGSVLLAEGVETRGERDTLRRLGVELGQGYLFGRPAPAAALACERCCG